MSARRESPWLTTREAADRLRKTPGAFRMFRHRNQNKPRAYKVGGKQLFRVTDIDRLVQPDVAKRRVRPEQTV